MPVMIPHVFYSFPPQGCVAEQDEENQQYQGPCAASIVVVVHCSQRHQESKPAVVPVDQPNFRCDAVARIVFVPSILTIIGMWTRSP